VRDPVRREAARPTLSAAPAMKAKAMKRKYKSVRWAVLTTLALQMGAAHALDLVGAFEQALRHDLSQLAADQALTAGREKAVQGDALLKPRVGVQAGIGRLDDHMSGNVPPAFSAVLPDHGSGTVRQATLQLNQPIYDAEARAGRQQLRQQA